MTIRVKLVSGGIAIYESDEVSVMVKVLIRCISQGAKEVTVEA